MITERTEYHKTYYKANKERINAARKARYAANKEREQATHKSYYEINKEQIKATSQTPSGRYDRLKANAKTRSLSCTLTLEEYELIIKSDLCHYCQHSIGTTCGSALDRKDSSYGYEVKNVVLCCGICNKAKSNYFTYEEMVSTIGPAICKAKEARYLGV